MNAGSRVDEILAKEASKITVSFEFFPPKTDKGEEALRLLLSRFQEKSPIFVDFTWGAGGSTSDKTPMWCRHCSSVGMLPNMHLTCTNMEEGKVRQALEFCKANDIRNIIALRGDPPLGEAWKASAEGFTCGLDLVKYIRKNYGDYFCLGVAGYPEGHPDRIDPVTGKISPEDMKKEIEYLKQKVDAGGNYVITQLFYDASLFIAFEKMCREAGITVPILPGILPMVSYAGLQRMVSICKTHMPPEVQARAEALKDDAEAFKEYGVQLSIEICKALLSSGVRHFHFYTLNLDFSTIKVMDALGV